MAQHGQVLKLTARRPDGKAVWAYRYRLNGSRSKRPQVGGFATRAAAERALRRELERLRPGRQMTLTELVERYLRVHEAAPATMEKLRWLLAKATAEFGEVRLADLRADEICAWRGALPEGVGFANSSASSPTVPWLGSALLPSWLKEGCLLWSFAYLVVRNLFALVWLLARPRRSKELEILVLRHELAMLRRRARAPKLTRADRVLLAALSRSLPRVAWAGFPVRPETLLRWHRQLVARRWTYTHRAPGRPQLESSLRTLILRLGHENPHWGYKRIVGELKGLGITISATSVRKVLLEEGLPPAPKRSNSSWRAFLRAQAGSVLACDFLTVETAFLQRVYVLFFISLATRRIEYIACTPNPDGHWTAQQARNLLMQLGDQQPFRFLIHDRDTKFSHGFDEVFRSEGIRVIRTPVEAPNANAHAERWVRTIRADCLDRILILGRRHLEHVLRVYGRHYNEHRPHRALSLLPPSGRDPTPLNALNRLQRRDLLGGLIHEYDAA